MAAARRARRSVLIGAPADGRTGKPEVFARLGSALRHDVWGKERDRLVARLHSVRGGERRRLESEAVADAPDVELRLYTPADGEPVLAEVAFPDGMPPAAAREYLVRELQEITCQPRLRTAVWTESADRVMVRFGPPDPAATFAALDPGVREELAGLETRAVHFATADGWNLELAQGWVAANVGRRDAGRIAPLARPYRACPGLARWLNAAFGLGFAVPPVADTESHVEFLAVPDAGPRRRDGRNDGRPPRVGGAGYETDLSDPRQRAALPADVAAALPASGIVNLPEAQALVRYLEGAHGPTPTVTSPFPAQVSLLRALAARSTRLGHARILDAAEAAVTECDLLAVSLTRSHIARAVTFGDAPAVLAGLLSRARRKILFAGDPGTLARRLQWDGPVDHLDAAEAGRERAWVAALADCPRVAPPRLRPSHADGVRA